MPQLVLDWNSWLYGMWWAIASAIADGVIIGVGLNVTDPYDWNAKEKGFYNLILPIIAITGTKAFFLYLKQNPAPKQITVESQRTTTLPSGKVVEEVTKTVATAPADEGK